jgi:hypothetical protein
MSLLNLPTELKLLAMEQMSPVDGLHFAMSCKEIWNACHPIVKMHGEKAKLYRHINLGTEESGVWALVNKILDEPSIANYVRETDMQEDRNVFYDPNVRTNDEITATTARPPPEDVTRYLNHAIKDPYLRVPLPQELQVEFGFRDGAPPTIGKALADGSDGPMINLFLSLVPNLISLNYTTDGDSFWLKHYLKYVALAYATPTSALPLQNLKHVLIWPLDNEQYLPWQWIRYFIALPSLRTIAAGLVGDSGWDDPVIPESLPKSNVTSLRFAWSELEVESLRNVLVATPVLVSFKYENGSLSEDVYDPKGIMAALGDHAAHSLKHLVLKDKHRVEVVSFSGFQ